jgi:hypothetical protein
MLRSVALLYIWKRVSLHYVNMPNPTGSKLTDYAVVYLTRRWSNANSDVARGVIIR